MSGTGLAVTLGIAYFVVAQFSFGLLLKPEGVAVFWPAAGISSGILIALGPWARWPVAAGAIGGTVLAHVIDADPLWAALAMGLCNATEAVITAELIVRYFGQSFRLDRLGFVVGFLAAAAVGTSIAGIGGAVTYRLLRGPSAPMLTTWQHWFTSDIIGIVTVAPLVIGIAAALRRRPRQNELIEGAVALAGLALITLIIIWLPQGVWQTLMPVAWLFPMLLWLAARCRPVFAAAGVFMVSLAFVCATIFGIGHFGSTNLSIDDRILGAQAIIVVVALCGLVLAALFSERRESETRLARSNMLLERERDNKLMNVQAITASIAHETRQPLAAIVASASAALRFLDHVPPDHDEVRAALNRIVSEGHRTADMFDGIRALFRKVDPSRQSINVNEVILDVLKSLQAELTDHRIITRAELTAKLPLIEGNRSQLHEVIFNLIHNALEAMDTIMDRNRVLRVKADFRGNDAIVVAVEDSGPGIDPKRLGGIFDAFFTTKSHGMGLGLAICRMIVEHHGGQLTATSDGKAGAQFQFVLPIKDSAVSSDRARVPHDGTPSTARWRRNPAS